jgi:hypothetical protein
MDVIDARVKTLVMILVGLGLIGFAAWMQHRHAGRDADGGPGDGGA